MVRKGAPSNEKYNTQVPFLHTSSQGHNSHLPKCSLVSLSSSQQSLGVINGLLLLIKFLTQQPILTLQP